ncbi:MAG: hypothetical protein MUF38_06105 [Anaerolineae bacterium]|nr:hypothetical protein [Anaerolineae bacterium]
MMRWMVWLLSLLGFGSIVHAQAVPICPPPVALSLARAGSACYDLANDEACFGGGTVTTDQYVGGAPLQQAGDRVVVDSLQRVLVAPADEGVSVAMLNIQADLPDAAEKQVSVLVFGAATIENLVPPTPRQVLTALGTVNIRALPALQTDILARYNIGQTLMANGITADGQWLRVAIPNTDDLGWVGIEVVSSNGDVRTLEVVTPETVLNRAFALLTIETDAGFSACDGALPAGVLIQTPNVAQPARLQVNGLNVALAGTALVQGIVNQTVIGILEGEAVIGGVYVPAGAMSGAETVEPLATVPLGLPLNTLPRRFLSTAVLTAEDISTLTAEYEARVEAVTAVIAPLPDRSCRRTARRLTDLWAGPGNFYEVINQLQPDQLIEPTLAVADPDGAIWWQLRDSNWVLARSIVETGDCAPVPLSDRFVPPPTNTLSLETCRTTNGPLRVGQQVRIEFRPPPFDNLGEARDAVRIDPGRITVGARRYRAEATEAIRLGTVDDRYIRTFYIYWTAVAGTFRIEGDRLTYEPICTITVPVG